MEWDGLPVNMALHSTDLRLHSWQGAVKQAACRQILFAVKISSHTEALGAKIYM